MAQQDNDQANYHKKAQDIIANNDLQFMSWTLYDFVDVPKEVVGKLPWRKNAQKQFGFINKNGQKRKRLNIFLNSCRLYFFYLSF